MWYGWHVVRCIPDIFKLWKYLRPFVVAVCPVERLGVCLAQKRSPSTGDMYTVFHWKRGTQSRPQLQGKKRNREKRNLWICRPLPRYIISSCTMYQFFLKQLYLGAPPQLSEQDRCSAAVLCLYQSPPIWILMSHVRIPHPSASLKQAVCPWTIDALPLGDNHWIVAVDQWHPHLGPAIPSRCHTYQDFSALIRPRNPDRLEICTQLTSLDLEVTEGILPPVEFMSPLQERDCNLGITLCIWHGEVFSNVSPAMCAWNYSGEASDTPLSTVKDQLCLCNVSLWDLDGIGVCL